MCVHYLIYIEKIKGDPEANLWGEWEERSAEYSIYTVYLNCRVRLYVIILFTNITI